MAAGGRLHISGVNNIKLQLNRRGSSARSVRATVEFTAEHAMMIHEDVNMPHPNGGQAKYLEQPATTKQREMGRIVEKHLKRKNGTLKQGVQESAEFLLTEAQKLVPVDTGELRDSGKAYTSDHKLTQWD